MFEQKEIVYEKERQHMCVPDLMALSSILPFNEKLIRF